MQPRFLIVAALVGAITGSAAVLAWQRIGAPTADELVRSFYLVENAVHVSPHTIRKKMDKGDTDFLLVDLRSPQEYEKEHIVGAVNIPAYKDPNTSISLESDAEAKDRIIRSFRELQKDKDVIVYCYSTPCMTGRKVGKLLAEHGIFVKHLGIGWNEWRYFWNLWNHDGEAAVPPADYVVGGKDPGTPKQRELPSPCGPGELSC